MTANEAKRIAQLSEAHMQASLQPILVLERREDRLRSLLDFLVNSGDGPAINVTAQYGGAVPPGSEVSVPNMLSSKGESSIRVDGGRAQKENLILRYESQDGRKFQTQIGVDSNWKPTHRHKALDARDQLQVVSACVGAGRRQRQSVELGSRASPDLDEPAASHCCMPCQEQGMLLLCKKVSKPLDHQCKVGPRWVGEVVRDVRKRGEAVHLPLASSRKFVEVPIKMKILEQVFCQQHGAAYSSHCA